MDVAPRKVYLGWSPLAEPDLFLAIRQSMEEEAHTPEEMAEYLMYHVEDAAVSLGWTKRADGSWFRLQELRDTL